MSNNLTIKETRVLLTNLLEYDPYFWDDIEHKYPKACASFCSGQTQQQRIREVVDYIFRQQLDQMFYKWLNEKWQASYQPPTD
jgi:hypothetical protein